jgi:hypothetical protein
MIEEAMGGDPKAEALAEAIYDAATKAGYDVNDPRFEAFDLAIQQIAGNAYQDGYHAGMADEKLAQEMERRPDPDHVPDAG